MKQRFLLPLLATSVVAFSMAACTGQDRSTDKGTDSTSDAHNARDPQQMNPGTAPANTDTPTKDPDASAASAAGEKSRN